MNMSDPKKGLDMIFLAAAILLFGRSYTNNPPFLKEICTWIWSEERPDSDTKAVKPA